MSLIKEAWRNQRAVKGLCAGFIGLAVLNGGYTASNWLNRDHVRNETDKPYQEVTSKAGKLTLKTEVGFLVEVILGASIVGVDCRRHGLAIKALQATAVSDERPESTVISHEINQVPFAGYLWYRPDEFLTPPETPKA
jgi:hypothetical protein